MSDLQFGDVSMLHLLWLVPVLVALMLYAAVQRRRALARFVSTALLDRIGVSSRPDPARRVVKGALVVCAVAALVLALTRPSWGAKQQEVTQRGRDVVFLLDVSRSMLAEDLPPNRLERAKLAILDALDRLTGDRVALAVFAGSTVVKCPLTLDYGFFRMALNDVSPLSVTRGGSLIGDGLRTVVKDVFDGKRSNYRDIVLITDGEDHESFPVEAAVEAGELGARLIAIGLGDERVGRRIPVQAEGQDAGGLTFLQFEGQEVWSRLDSHTLRKMAGATPGGRYLNVATGSIDFGDVYRRLIATADDQELATRTIETLEERFQLFLAICLLLLALDIALRDRAVARGPVAFLALLTLLPGSSSAASTRGLVNEGNQAYAEGEFDRALQSYEEALEQDPDSPHAALNRANALYRSGQFEDAAEAYTRSIQASLDRSMPELEAAALHNLGNALYRQAEQLAPQNPGQALSLLTPAARSYLDALRADARRLDSAANLEVTRRMIRELREQMQPSPQSQSGGQQGSDEDEQDQQQDRSQDREDALRDAAEEQEQLADQSEQLDQDRQNQTGTESRQEQRQRAQDLADRQEDLNQRTQELADGADPQTREAIEDAARNQQQASQSLEDNQAGEAAEAQREAAQALRAAAGDGPRDPQPSPGEQAEDGTSGDPAMTMESILAKEQQDRRKRAIRQQGRIAPVNKDW